VSAAPDVLTSTPPEGPPPPARARGAGERAYAAVRHAAANPFVRLAYFSLVALVTMWPLLGTANQINMYQDSQQHSLFEEAARLAVARFHELPLWDPYYCGGLYGLGTPSARFVGPTFALTLLFGTLRGATLTHLVMTVVGLEGAFRYMRSRGAGALPAMMTAPTFALSGVFAHATLVAWTNFFGFELVPCVLLSVRAALTGSRRGLVATALFMAWMIGFGGTYTAPLTTIAVAFEVVVLVLAQLRRAGEVSRGARLGRIVVMGLCVVALSAAMSMVRLWPIAETLTASPRLLGGKPGSLPEALMKHLFGDKGNHWVKGEFYVGLPVIPLIAFGAWRRRSVAHVVGIALWLWFALGYKVPLSIFAALRAVPPYTMLRAPERFLVFAALAAATIAALGVRRLEVAMRKRPSYLLLALAVYAVILGDTYMLVHCGWLRVEARKMETAPPRVDRDFRQDRGNRWIAAYYPWMSRGSLTCFDDYDVMQSPELRGDLPAEEYLKDTGAGTVRRVGWSPDHIDLQVDLTRPARVFVNQNWHPGWRSTVGDVTPDDGLLAVDVPEGSHLVTLRFRPRSATGGGLTTLLALAAAGWLAHRARGRPGGSRDADRVTGLREAGETALVCFAPLAAVAGSLLLIREPRWPPPPLLTPAGEPMIVERSPEDANPVGARWDEGITLDAAHFEVEPADDTHGPLVTVELDWRFDKPLPSTLGVFMQFETEGQKFSTDHILLSGVVVPEEAPLHTIVRDVSDPIAFPQRKGDATWQAWAGVWRARRDMSRLPVADKGQTTEHADRVLVGSFVIPQRDTTPAPTSTP
jgi:hypothetical protein